ncbi:MAG: hypothetical protein ACC628_04640 [Pirellulaceae bacterium]
MLIYLPPLGLGWDAFIPSAKAILTTTIIDGRRHASADCRTADEVR